MKKIYLILALLMQAYSIQPMAVLKTVNINDLEEKGKELIAEYKDKLPIAKTFIKGVIDGKINVLEELRNTLKENVARLDFNLYFQFVANNLTKLKTILQPLLNDAKEQLANVGDASIKDKILFVINKLENELPRLDEIAKLMKQIDPNYLRLTVARIDMIINAIIELKNKAESDPRIAQIWNNLKGDLEPILTQLDKVYTILSKADFNMIGQAVNAVVKAAKNEELSEEESFAMISGLSLARRVAVALIQAEVLSIKLALKTNKAFIAAGIITQLPPVVQNIFTMAEKYSDPILNYVNEVNSNINKYIGTPATAK